MDGSITDHRFKEGTRYVLLPPSAARAFAVHFDFSGLGMPVPRIDFDLDGSVLRANFPRGTSDYPLLWAERTPIFRADGLQVLRLVGIEIADAKPVGRSTFFTVPWTALSWSGDDARWIVNEDQLRVLTTAPGFHLSAFRIDELPRPDAFGRQRWRDDIQALMKQGLSSAEAHARALEFAMRTREAWDRVEGVERSRKG